MKFSTDPSAEALSCKCLDLRARVDLLTRRLEVESPLTATEVATRQFLLTDQSCHLLPQPLCSSLGFKVPVPSGRDGSTASIFRQTQQFWTLQMALRRPSGDFKHLEAKAAGNEELNKIIIALLSFIELRSDSIGVLATRNEEQKEQASEFS